MKKALILLVPALALLASCGDAIELPDVDGSGNTPDEVTPEPPVSGDVVFTATAEDLADGSQLAWKTGDQILLSDGTTVQTLSNRAAAGPVAEFPGKIAEGKTSFVAVYPAASGVSLQGTTATFEVPTGQTGAGPSYRVAKATGTLLYFRSLVSEIRFTVGYEGVTKVRFQTTGEKIAGKVTVDYSGSDPVVTATDDYVEVTGTFEPGKTYSFSALPGSIEGYTVVAYSGDKETAHVSGGAVELKKGIPANLPAFQQDIPTYRITNMWVCGGTGPEYGGAGVIDILTKPNYFNEEDGRGITALKDNYYQLRPDGTFVNYAGEDGRNWWFVYSGSVNPANGKDLDLRKFYDVLPLSEGRYALDGNTVTFTKADGSTTQALFLGPGTYEVPGAGGKSVTITRQALAFTITGGKDDWNNIYKDYDKIAARPRALFIEMEAMPDGFLVPAASQTTDADFEYVEPGSTFDWASLPGSWNVFGGNASPFGIWVLGGSGDDPAFVSPIDKSWDWDDTIWKESDNGFVIAVTSMEGTTVKGTTNWWAGDDGAFWNYTWKGTGEDLSRFYNMIPKGKHEFTLDMKSMTVTYDNGRVAKFLTPGTHEFVYGKTIDVRDNCFALAFHLMDPIPATDQRWTDVDRFVNAPLEYVIMFEKQ
ncbi:MAG: hypothetical protein II874_00530 [Bacteroidales bacterium]|nr:hypothetical protein [Bacteroidales bacterium]